MKKKQNIQKTKDVSRTGKIENIPVLKTENENKAVKNQRCDPCMHCGVHCIFLKDE